MMNNLRGLWRGKRKDNGEWVKGLLVKMWGKFHLQDQENENLVIEIDPSTLGECTCVPDKNGKQIFEGDIVKGNAYSSEWRGVIVWIPEIAGFGVKYRQRETPTAWEKSSILRNLLTGRKDEFAAEVIGNIHDNPELLSATGADEGNAAKDCLLSAT